MICGTAWNTVPFGLIHVYVPMSAENPRCYSGILHMSVKASCRHIYHIENKISNNILSAISINKQIKSQQIQQSLKISHKHVIYNTHTIHHTNTKNTDYWACRAPCTLNDFQNSKLWAALAVTFKTGYATPPSRLTPFLLFFQVQVTMEEIWAV